MADHWRCKNGTFSLRLKDIQIGYGHRGVKLFLEGMLYDQLWGELQQFEDDPIHFWLVVKSISTIEQLIKVEVYTQERIQIPELFLPGEWEVEVEIKDIEK